MYTESVVEEATLDWFRELRFDVLHGPDIDPESEAPARDSFGDLVLRGRLEDALAKLNPGIPPESLEQARKGHADGVGTSGTDGGRAGGVAG